MSPAPEQASPEADLSTEERTILSILKAVPGYKFDFSADRDHIRRLEVDFPNLDMLAQVKKWRDYKVDKPLDKKSSPRMQLRNWMDIAEKRRIERGEKPARPKHEPPKIDPNYHGY